MVGEGRKGGGVGEGRRRRRGRGGGWKDSGMQTGSYCEV